MNPTSYRIQFAYGRTQAETDLLGPLLSKDLIWLDQTGSYPDLLKAGKAVAVNKECDPKVSKWNNDPRPIYYRIVETRHTIICQDMV